MACHVSLTWISLCPACICMHVDTWFSMCHPTPVVSKNVKFLLSRNSTKFVWVTRFRETNLVVRSVSSSIISFQPVRYRQIIVLPFFRKIQFFPGFTIATLKHTEIQSLFLEPNASMIFFSHFNCYLHNHILLIINYFHCHFNK